MIEWQGGKEKNKRRIIVRLFFPVPYPRRASCYFENVEDVVVSTLDAEPGWRSDGGGGEGDALFFFFFLFSELLPRCSDGSSLPPSSSSSLSLSLSRALPRPSLLPFSTPGHAWDLSLCDPAGRSGSNRREEGERGDAKESMLLLLLRRSISFLRGAPSFDHRSIDALSFFLSSLTFLLLLLLSTNH